MTDEDIIAMRVSLEYQVSLAAALLLRLNTVEQAAAQLSGSHQALYNQVQTLWALINNDHNTRNNQILAILDKVATAKVA